MHSIKLLGFPRYRLYDWKQHKKDNRPIGDTWGGNLELSRHSKIKNAMPEIKNSINRFC